MSNDRRNWTITSAYINDKFPGTALEALQMALKALLIESGWPKRHDTTVSATVSFARREIKHRCLECGHPLDHTTDESEVFTLILSTPKKG